jgi:hypothetical protein
MLKLTTDVIHMPFFVIQIVPLLSGKLFKIHFNYFSPITKRLRPALAGWPYDYHLPSHCTM